MRIKWRGLELPSRVVRDETVSTDFYGRFVAEPFEHGFGTTIGNSLRRILLSSIEGAAVTTAKIAGVSHEFCAMDGVVEDVTDIVLNIKGIQLVLEDDETETLTIRRETAGEIKAGDFDMGPGVTIVNPDHHIATLTEDVKFHMDLTVRQGRGYAAAVENRSPEQELGVIPVDSVFSPVVRVRYRTEEMRVGQKTNYDRLILEIWTRGTIDPEDALVEAGSVLRKHLNPFVMYHELGNDTVAVAAPEPAVEPEISSERQELLSKPASFLNLSVRAGNCLEQARIATILELVTKTETDLLRVRSFGRTSLHEVQRKLAEHGMSLGMKLGPEGLISTPEISEERLAPIDDAALDPIAAPIADVTPTPTAPVPPSFGQPQPPLVVEPVTEGVADTDQPEPEPEPEVESEPEAEATDEAPEDGAPEQAPLPAGGEEKEEAGNDGPGQNMEAYTMGD